MSQDENSRNQTKLKIHGDLPIRTVGIETERERKNYTDLPPQNYMHVWWARRPTPATRLAILGSVLPESIDDDTLLRWMGIDPSNLNNNQSVAEHVRQKRRREDRRKGLVYEHYGYRKIWKKNLDEDNMSAFHDVVRDTWGGSLPTILDATAGGGSIPFESVRYGLPTIANELNPVPSVLLKAVLEHPRVNGDLSSDIEKWGEEINNRARSNLVDYFANPDGETWLVRLWAHTVSCPDCGLTVPLAPNWWLDKQSGSEGIAARPQVSNDSDSVEFDVVELPSEVQKSTYDPSDGTSSRGKATCPRCHVVVSGEEIKGQAQDEGLGFQLYAIEAKDRNGKRDFRSPQQNEIEAYKKACKKAEHDPDISSILSEDRYIGLADRAANYGVTKWRDMFSPRQLLVHYEYWQAFEDIKEEVRNEYSKEEGDAILTFLAIAADKAVDYNSRICSWIPSNTSIGHSFDRHDFSFKWSFVENNLTAEGLGYEWILENTIKAYSDLHDLSKHSNAPVEIYQGDAASLIIDNESVDVIVLDPPYYDNVMYAELSDFFYVWLKRYVGDIYPEFFSKELTEKQAEAVANPSKFDEVAGEGQSKRELAKKDYEDSMTSIFEEMYRVLDDDGVFTLMFTHKKTEAWDTLTTALIEAGFSVKATHPVNTERKDSLHQKGKNSAESTILLNSEKRLIKNNKPTLWSEIRRDTRQVAREKARQLDKKEVDFAKVDIILASFGPTLEVFTHNYPVIDDEGNEVRPQVALDEARTAVRDYLIDQYLTEGVRDVDQITEWYILAWLVFEVQRFPYDEANRLGKGVGIEVDDIKRSQRLWRKKGSDIVLRPHEQRVQTPADKEKSRTTKPIDPDAITYDTDLDKLHSVMYVYNTLGLVKTEKYIKDRGFDTDPAFRATFEALLKVLPPTHDDWELLRDMALTDVGKLVDLDVDTETFQRGTTHGDEIQQDKLSNYD